MAGRAGIARFGDGQSTLDTRLGQQGEFIGSDLHGQNYEQAVRKQIFFSLCVARATSLPAQASVGNIVYNPPDSGVNLALLKWQSQVLVTSATLTGIGLAVGYQPTTPTTVTGADATGCTYLQQPTFITGKAKAYAIATVLLAPVMFTMLHHNTAAIAVTGIDQATGDLDSSIIVPPGHFVAFAAAGAAAAASGHTSWISWEEVPTL